MPDQLIFHPSDQVFSLKQAAFVSGWSYRVVRNLCHKHRISQQAGPCTGIRVHATAFLMAIHGDSEALELLRGGEHGHPTVVRYKQAAREALKVQRAA